MSGNPGPMPIAELFRTPPEPSIGSSAADDLLYAVREYLDMDVALICEFRRRDRIFRHVNARERSPVQCGDVRPLSDDYWQRTANGKLPALIPDSRKVAAALELPETRAFPIGAHLGVPIRLSDGRIYGTICCFSFSPDITLGERDVRMLQTVATLLAQQIDRDRQSQRSRDMKIERIRKVIASGQPAMAFQPICHLRYSRLAGLECLARFQVEPQRPPDQWFAEAAEVGLAVDLELVGICSALRALPVVPANAYMAVSCSPQTLLCPELHKLLNTVELKQVVLEVSEHAIEDDSALLEVLATLRAMGMRVALDGAGAGDATLNHLRHLQPDLIKLDASVTRGIDSDPGCRAVALALIAFAKETRARVVAVGVETESELRTLMKLGVHSAQGYFLGKPMSLGDALRHQFQAGFIGQRRTRARGSARPG